ncbi:phosphoglucosamine mutase [Teredinibacter turnerae]|uniref:Phosphoglucosamine mutase n=1 Tax=Teredinibacter turnerae (strain ATCC 39867 / T7901) TaxID=377629 RepID=GLMM_TERTT|nr:phosphoglucosamine mutase [Teredinibacter turnerae]C5BQ00.1 RecName: Full=Phosphoglucosamine mutase [Teredinibacter turnerae T7901]ACR12878.1 phosphoglucosamine mutase [Teredinibacter turnerae T7901]
MTRKYFGTDGIRGQVGQGVITPQFFMQLGWAVGKVLAERHADGGGLVLIGKDTRISGYMFESALEAGLIAAGVDVGLLGPMPTPAIAYLTRTFQASAGIVISASHNPFRDNGIKLFNTQGVKLADDVEAAIEHQVDRPMVTAERLGKARRVPDAEGRYIEFCKGTLPWGFSLAGLTVVVDCANGATYNVAPKVFSELGAEVIAISTHPDGENINLNCGSTKLNNLQKQVLESHADIGIAFDGDGDRVQFVDERGEVVDGDQLLFIIAAHKQRHGGGCSGVVGTQMSNFGFELALEALKIPFERAKVGDRYVIEAMNNNGWKLGGESSGHIVCADVTTTGDGIIAALQVLRALNAEAQTLYELKQRMQKMPQVMVNVPVKRKLNLEENDMVQTAIAEAEQRMEGQGRVLLRPSGTEPVIRVMVEGQQHGMVSQLAHELAEVVGRATS